MKRTAHITIKITLDNMAGNEYDEDGFHDMVDGLLSSAPSWMDASDLVETDIVDITMEDA